MTKITSVLFDFDGVIVNTEPLYDEYMDDVAAKYNLGIENFANKIKGSPTPAIIQKYFSHLNAKEISILEQEIEDFEQQMDMPPIEGALEFIEYLKTNNYKIALVTSSQQIKMTRALDMLGLTGIFDSEVTANRITQGKPHPMCFELAARDLGVNPENCIVFEDSIHGINAGLGAKMKVIGLTTSFSKEVIEDKVHATISDFSDIEKVLELLN